MPTRRILATLLTVLTAASVSAQGSPLVVKTTHAGLAQSLLDRFGGSDELPDLKEGECHELMLDDGGKVSASVGQGLVNAALIEARPAMLMDLFGDDLAVFRGRARGVGAMALGQTGLATKEAVKIVDGVLEFPTQVALARLMIDGDLDHPENGLRLQLWLDPMPGTWLSEVVKGLRPAAKGYPVLDDPGAAMSVRISADPAGLAKAMQPFAEVGASIGADSAEARAENLALIEKTLLAYDGGIAMTWNLEGAGMTFAAGLRDPATMQELYASPQYIEWIKAMSAPNPQMEVEFTPNALTHRDVKLFKSVTTMEMGFPMPNNPIMKDGKIESWGGVVGNYLISTAAGSEATVKALVDDVLDGKLKRDNTKDMTRAVITLRLADFVDAMAGGMVPTDNMPSSFELKIGSSENSLFFRINIQ